MSSAAGYNGLVERDGKLLPPLDNQGDLRSFSDYLRKYAHTVKPDYKPGTVYQYRGLNTEILTLAAERAAGLNLAEMMDKYLWSKGGFNSYMTLYVDQTHNSLAAGSMNCTARDFAIGSWLMGHGGKNWKDEQIVPKNYIEQINNGDEKVKKAWDKVSYEHTIVPNAFYKNQWRTLTDDKTGRSISVMIGVNGQWSAYDNKTGNVVAVFGAYREHTGLAEVELYFYDIILPLFEKMDKDNL
jgi:CubicO group peptidase (beta-lactamase class C family)